MGDIKKVENHSSRGTVTRKQEETSVVILAGLEAKYPKQRVREMSN